jgi:hypothetical protein
MQIVSVSSPQYSRADHSSIDSMVTFDNGMTYPYMDLNAGIHGAIAAYISP